MHRMRILAAVAVAVALLSGYSVYWFIVAAQLERGIDNWVAFQRQAGLTVDFERTPVTGFPLEFRTTFRKPHIAGATAGQDIDWQGPDVVGSVSPLNLHTMTFSGPGHHTIDLGGGPATLDAGDLTVRLAFDGAGQVSSLAVTLGDLHVTLPDDRTVVAASGTVSLSAAPSPPKSDADPLLQFDAAAQELKLPEGTVLLTADPLSEAKIAGAVKGPFPLLPLRQALVSWRDAGGTVEIKSFAAAQATLALSGSATIALDDNLQPIVAANVNARGLGPTIDLLASQRRIYPEDALKMKLFVKGAERDTKDGYKEVATGITVQGSYLSWGPFKLAKVPPIQWP